MAIVVYKCDVCKREIELQRNNAGLERIQRCTITHGCRGKLYQTNVLTDYIRGATPSSVTGLDDWQQRRVLYDHVQTIERNTWTITHNLGTFPSVSVYVNRPTAYDAGNLEEITPQDIIVVDANTIRVVFDRAWSGIAQLIARQSDPNLLQPIITTQIAVSQPFQLSKSGEITIATRSAITNVGIKLAFTSAGGSVTEIAYAIDDQPSTNSAWADFDKVVVKGKIYTVRSFNAITADMTTGNVGTGSTFTFSGINPTGTDSLGYRDIQSNEVILLLASDPYETVDKITTKYIDTATIEDPFALYYDAGEFYSLEDAVQSVYPPIRSV